MISRRPNKHASTEKAPGPRAAMANRMVSAKTAEGFESNSVGVQAGRSESQIPRAPSSTAPQVKGVEKPISNRPPATIAAKPTAQAAVAALGSRT